MGVRYDYFAAPSDEAAAKVISSGPVGFRTVETKWLDPVVVMGKLEELLTGRAYGDVVGDPRCGKDLAVEHGGELLVLTVTDGLRDGLAGADLGDVAVRWAGIEELRGFEVEDLRGILDELAALAAEAVERGERLYCWVCV
ncbi:hypothetical protein [Lentzea flava]|uniref:PPM-type phosphatase domain-containing protein n=1 Tax=Lentzea flava TaxID=103732 RepID=A0ABQ2UXK1_9PSEU|nr:hypothetical protein [Lentzea flava]MCP2201955.1 hypothetical protein [Lentzea flava]GGU56503.1 hypothetical protein GCM10010178_56190 [Lentzea flava]